MGFVPNVIRLLSNSPTALNAFVTLQGTLGKTLDLNTRGAVALAVSNANDCNYCQAVHGFIANAMAKASPEEIKLNLQGKSSDPKRAAAATFGKRLIETRGKVADADVDAIKKAGFSEAEIIEIVALTAQVLMTNFMNNLAQTEIDVPAVTDVAA
jgi:uncharacterized peroxidase-related enzyme